MMLYLIAHWALMSCYWLHTRRLNSTYPMIKSVEIFQICFGLKITNGALCNAVKLVSKYYKKEYENIKEHIKKAKAVYVDETGWRIKGINHWLWVFVTKNEALFKVDKRRSSEVPKEVLGEDFIGVLISDFYSAYHTKLPYKKQKCLVHLLRDCFDISHNNEETKKFFEDIKQFIKDAAKFKETNPPQEEIAKAKKKISKETHQNHEQTIHRPGLYPTGKATQAAQRQSTHLPRRRL